MSVDILSHPHQGVSLVNQTLQKQQTKDTTNAGFYTNGSNSNDTVERLHARPANWVDVRDEVLWKPHQRLRLITIGAGFSGKDEDLEYQIFSLTPASHSQV